MLLSSERFLNRHINYVYLQTRILGKKMGNETRNVAVRNPEKRKQEKLSKKVTHFMSRKMFTFSYLNRKNSRSRFNVL